MAKTARRDPRLSKTQIIAVALLAVLVVIAVDFGGLLIKSHDLDLQAASLQQEIQQLDAQHVQLQQQLDFVRSDEYVRTVAPDLLLWGDPGAKYLMPVEGMPAPTATPKP
jgi:cell division protein FtsB